MVNDIINAMLAIPPAFYFGTALIVLVFWNVSLVYRIEKLQTAIARMTPRLTARRKPVDPKAFDRSMNNAVVFEEYASNVSERELDALRGIDPLAP